MISKPIETNAAVVQVVEATAAAEEAAVDHPMAADLLVTEVKKGKVCSRTKQ